MGGVGWVGGEILVAGEQQAHTNDRALRCVAPPPLPQQISQVRYDLRRVAATKRNPRHFTPSTRPAAYPPALSSASPHRS